MEISIVLTIAIIAGLELATLIARIFFGSVKRFRDKRNLPPIHLMYLGIVLLALMKFWYFLEIGLALILQGLIHHFIVLPILAGETEFT